MLIMELEENTHFWHIMSYFKKGKNATEVQKKISAGYAEGVAGWMCQEWFVKFHAEDSWMMFHSWVDQLRLTAIKFRH